MALPVLYSFRRCPYAMRARLAIAISGVSVELREIKLSAKPPAMLEASPTGTVPVVVLPDGAVIEQSLDVMHWALLQHDPEGWLERDDATGHLYNAAALVGPDGFVAGYRKAHLPCLGIDRFTTPGDRPFAVHDLGGLRVGLTICYDGSFPEASRVLALLGADLILLPTNWPPEAERTARLLVPARAMENRVYYAAVNRVGTERGFRFIGLSRVADVTGDLLAASESDEETILYAEIDPARARQKRIVNVPGEYEVDRLKDRRPDLYGPLVGRD